MSLLQHYVIMGFGAFVALAGLALMFYGTGTGNSRVRFGQLEFEISTPSLVVFLVGSALFVLPVALDVPDLRPSQERSDGAAVPSTADRARVAPSGGGGAPGIAKLEPGSDPFAATLIGVGETIEATLRPDGVHYFKTSPLASDASLVIAIRRIRGNGSIIVYLFDQFERQIGYQRIGDIRWTARFEKELAREDFFYIRVDPFSSREAITYQIAVEDH